MAIYAALLRRMDAVSIFCPIFEHAKKTPQALALLTDDRAWTYAEMDSAVHVFCHFLKKAGVQKGDRVAFIAKTHTSTILLFFALFRLSSIACPLSFRIPKEQMESHLAKLSASHFFTPELLPLSGETSCFEAIDLDAPATFLLTSGSSGTPKAACHLFSQHHYSALGAIAALKLESSSRWLLSLPLFHVSGIGILIRCFQCGAAVVLSSLPTPQTIAKYVVSHLSQVPTQLYRVLKEPDLAFTHSLKCLLLGGAPLSPDLIEQALEHNIPLFTTYGMTEMSSMITLSGKVLPFRELKVEKDGEIWVRGKTLFEGYWDAATKRIIKEGKDWFPTKDLGRLMENGDLEILGRKDRQFISGGENIQPEEIEKALCTIPGILQASVLPVSDPEFGKRPIAFIHDETGSHTLESIREALLDTIPTFKHPIAILPYPEQIGLKPSLSALRQYLTQIPEWAARSRG